MKYPRDNPLARRVLAAILLCSTSLAFVATGLQLLIDYQHDVSTMKTRLDEIERSRLNSISAALWAMEDQQIRKQLEGIASLPDVAQVQLKDPAEKLLIQVGSVHDDTDTITREMPIRFVADTSTGHVVGLGTLVVTTSMSRIYRELKNKALVILATQTAKTLIVAIFALFIFNFLVSRHLSALAAYARRLDFANLGNLLSLSRKPPKQPDELDVVVSAINEMTSSLKQDFDELERYRNTLEDKVAERTQQLQASLESRRLMVANVSHELRTPVNALRLLLDTLTLGGVDEKQIISRVKSITGHMCQLVDNLLLLDPDQPSARGTAPDETFDLGSEIRATTHLVGPVRQGSSALFVLDVDQCTGVKVSGNRYALRRIIINLLTNAFKFTSTGSVSLFARADIDIGEGVVRCTIRVKDTGEGIPARMHERIFDPFVTSGVKNGHTGTGLGLPISRQLAENLNGSLKLIDSEEHKGSTFECVVRFNQAVSMEAVQGADVADDPAATLPHRRLRILLAEDDVVTAETVKLIIQLLKHDVTHVATFHDLCTELQSPVYDLALIDNRLPGGSGLDAAKTWRSATGMRLVLMTAEASSQVLEEARAVCDDVVLKPTSADCIRRLLGETVAAQPVRIVQDEIINPAPFATLRRCGVPCEKLAGICEVFYERTADALGQIQSMLGTIDVPVESMELRELVHRIRSACATVGAIGLDSAFQMLSLSASRAAAEQQLERLVQTFELTRQALHALLEEDRCA